jgi:hypothetical protein
MTQEALSSLKALGNQLRLRLLESPEFRALTVVDRTIAELSEILNASGPLPLPLDDVAPPPVNEPKGESSAIAPNVKPNVETLIPGATSSQSRMARVIAETIAAKAAPLNAPPASTLGLHQALSAAS